MNKPFSDPSRTWPMSGESVNFKNGMIVTADDLATAMHYPVSLMQTVNKAVFGCGVVCGFKLDPDPELCGEEGVCDPCAGDDGDQRVTHPNFILQIGKGTALDCSGLPIELCKPVRFDISPETCGCDRKGGKVCIFVRRTTSDEAPRGDCCAPSAGMPDCSRQRDHIEIKAFPMGEFPEHACMHPMDAPGEGCGCGGSDSTGLSERERAAAEGQNPSDNPGRDDDQTRQRICECLIKCDDCDCCGEGWVMLGCVEICEGGIVKDSLKNPYTHRKWIKTIECLCGDLRKETDVAEAPGEVVTGQDQLLLLMSRPDAQIEAKLQKIVSGPAQLNALRAMNIRNLEHFEYVLENQRDVLGAMSQFKGKSISFERYITASRELRAAEAKPKG